MGEQIDWLEGVQYAIAVPGPHRCQRVKLQLANVACTISATSVTVTMCHSALSNNPQLYITHLYKMWLAVYVLIDAHPPLVGWGGAGLDTGTSLLTKCCLL